MRILQVSTADFGGGAESVARALFNAYRARGHWSRLAVGRKTTDDPDVIPLKGTSSARGGGGFLRRVLGERWARIATDPENAVAHWRGYETTHAPASWRLLDLFRPEQPDILHCHNLHGLDYFDLRALPYLSAHVPVVLTLQDGWLFTGHCAQSLGCERWRIGCGQCPDLTLYPAIRRDATATNLRRKRAIFAGTRAYISAPSEWLLRRARQSHLLGAAIEMRVIPNGVDTHTFAPGTAVRAREELGLPREAAVLLFVANQGAANRWKDYGTLRAALERLGGMPGEVLVCLVLGGEERTEQFGRARIWHVPPRRDPRRVARLFQAADLYVHAARADTFPLSVLESLACGTPVVATRTGGIPEQVRPLAVGRDVRGDAVRMEEATGALVPPGQPELLSAAIAEMLADRSRLKLLGENARRDALQRFDMDRVVSAWLGWYEEIAAEWRPPEG